MKVLIKNEQFFYNKLKGRSSSLESVGFKRAIILLIY